MILPEPIELIIPDWPCPPNVRALVSTRRGGCSRQPYAGANLGDHVGDDPAAVAANRALLAEQTGVRQWPWLKQVHGVHVMQADDGAELPHGMCADAIHTHHPRLACAVLTADCLPVLLCNSAGTEVAAAHAGWRGLASGVVNNCVAAFACNPQDLLAYLGPAIGPHHFEVGKDVYDTFAATFAGLGGGAEWRAHFAPANREGHFLADLYGLARSVLYHLGVQQIYGGDYCTFADAARFYSYRRDGVTGRMISAIWLEP